MIVSKLRQLTGWDLVKESALDTIGKKPITPQPTSEWKRYMLIAEHSPIRMLQYKWRWEAIKTWVTTHFVRHHEGVEKFVSTQRTDRTGVSRDELPQGSLNAMSMTANAQSLINISRVRLCKRASLETRQAWEAVRDEISRIDPEMARAMVPNCIYRGFCPERSKIATQDHCCGYCDTDEYRKALTAYRDV